MRSVRLMTAAVLFLSAADATAGPIRDRLRARFGGSCASGQCAPAVAFPAATTAPAAAPVVTPTAPASSCPGGACPVPTAAQRGVFFRR